MSIYHYQKNDLQTLQNNALRICLRYRLANRISERMLQCIFLGKVTKFGAKKKVTVIENNVSIK